MTGPALGIVVCLLIVSACSGSYAADSCTAPHEKWRKCGVLRTCWNQEPKDNHCKEGCFCDEGRVRNKEGRCVTPSECPKPEEICRSNEEFTECGSACPTTCSTLGEHKLCADHCVKGCFCKNGFVKDDKGICIPRSQCPALQKPQENVCGKDEEHYNCIPTCRDTCDNYNVTYPVCPLICRSGCFCRSGWVKNRDGQCVPTCQCDQKPGDIGNPPTEKCEEGEEYFECGTACPKTCQSRFIKVRCEDKCVPGCFCKGDLVRHEGKCIDIEKCPNPNCGVNEQYTQCGSACAPTCASLANSEPQTCTQQCIPGCFCKDGFVRDRDGPCVRPRQCPQNQCVENEEYDTCGSACPETCANKGQNRTCTLQCKIGCFCKKGYVRNGQGKCIPPDQCPSGNNECAGLNEAMSDCAKPKTCNTCEIRGNCNLKRCERGCDCKPGCYRNSTGTCIEQALCPGSDHPGVSDCSLPPEVGPGRAREIRFYFDAASAKCMRFTYGGREGNNNNFRSEQECNRKCGKQKVEYDCEKEPVKGDCKGRIRRFYFDSKSALCKVFDYGGCGGNKNNFRSRGECVKKCGGPAGLGSAGSVCELTPEKGPCTSSFPRFFFDKANGTCEKFTYGGCQGNKNNFKSEDECYQQCGDGSSERPDCTQPAESGPCDSMRPRFYFEFETGECKPFNYGGCGGNSNNFKTAEECRRKCGKSPVRFDCDQRAAMGPCFGRFPRYYYDSIEGVCKGFVYGGCGGNKNNFKTIEECNKRCGDKGRCGESEVYNECGSACPRTCRNIYSDVACIEPCVKGCFCKVGLVRNDHGKCVDPKQCSAGQCGQNEQFSSCGSACPETCDNRGKPRSCIQECKAGCVCKDGFVRDARGKCVSPDQCPKGNRRFRNPPRHSLRNCWRIWSGWECQ